MRLFIGGDVMTGRGIDQILRHPADPRIYESWATRADDYVRLAERTSGPIPRAVADDYFWGALLDDLAGFRPDLRIVNLETAVTRAERPEPKGINYRMNPDNAEVLTAAGLDACVLANNHVMDRGVQGLLETLETLHANGLRTVGAGAEETQAEAPLILPAGGARLIVAAAASTDSGVPSAWRPGPIRPGVALLPDPPTSYAEVLRARIAPLRRPGDRLMVSVHWGGNWGYQVPRGQRDLAHALIEQAGADVVFGHSSHHPKAAEVHRGGLILYGCGDLLNDYEGIEGHEVFPTETALGYVLDLPPGGNITCRMRPYRIHRFRLEHAAPSEATRIGDIMIGECSRFGTTATQEAGGDIVVQATRSSA